LALYSSDVTLTTPLFEVMTEVSFDSAHFLRDYEGKCTRLHGHTYRLQAYAQGQQLSSQGILLDLTCFKELCQQAVAEFDHQTINEVPPFDQMNPTAENLAAHFFRLLQPVVKERGLKLAKVVVWESPTSGASYSE
jgi:6-pyruvoyltetrahydropterin/6-carboxytetrahydropterin synthase